MGLFFYAPKAGNMDILSTKTQEKSHNMVVIHEFADGVVSARPFDAHETWFYDSAERCAIDCGGGYQRQEGDCREKTSEKARANAKTNRKSIRKAFDYMRNEDGSSNFEYSTSLTCYDTDLCHQPRKLMTKAKKFIKENEGEIGACIAVLEFKDGAFHVHLSSMGKVDTNAWMDYVGSANFVNQYSEPIEDVDAYETYMMKDLANTYMETPPYTSLVYTNFDTKTKRTVYMPLDVYNQLNDDDFLSIDENDLDSFIVDNYEEIDSADIAPTRSLRSRSTAMSATSLENDVLSSYDKDSNYDVASTYDEDFAYDVIPSYAECSTYNDFSSSYDPILRNDDQRRKNDMVWFVVEYVLYRFGNFYKNKNNDFSGFARDFDPFVYIYNAREDILRGKAPPGLPPPRGDPDASGYASGCGWNYAVKSTTA